jgi:hypothetical protein
MNLPLADPAANCGANRRSRRFRANGQIVRVDVAMW